MIGYMLRLDNSVKDDNGEPTMSPMKSDGALKFSVMKSVPLLSYWFFYFVYKVRVMMSLTFKGLFETILNVQTAKELDALLGTRVVIWALHFNPVELLISCKIEKLAFSISKARTGQSACCLSSFFQQQMIFPSICPVEDMKKTFRNKCISDADVLSFCDCPESYLKRKNMWEQLKSGKLHTIVCTWNNYVWLCILS